MANRLKLMNHNIGGNPTFSENEKNSCRNFAEVGSAMTIDDDSISYILTAMVKNWKRNSEEQMKYVIWKSIRILRGWKINWLTFYENKIRPQ